MYHGKKHPHKFYCSKNISDTLFFLIQEGKKVPKLDKILEEESDEDDNPDQEIQIQEHKVKLVVGPGGEKIKFIQRKSKCRLQVKLVPYSCTWPFSNRQQN